MENLHGPLYYGIFVIFSRYLAEPFEADVFTDQNRHSSAIIENVTYSVGICVSISRPQWLVVERADHVVSRILLHTLPWVQNFCDCTV